MVTTRSQTKRRAYEDRSAEDAETSPAGVVSLPLLSKDASTSRTKRRKIERQKKKYEVLIRNKLPDEVWANVCSYLYPSQVSVLAYVCRNLHRMVTSLYSWQTICQRAKLGVPKRKFSSYYALAVAHGSRVCEECYMLGRPVESGSGSVLPVQLSPQEKIGLCLRCRRRYYEKHEEPLTHNSEESSSTNNDNSENSSSAASSQHRRIERITKTRAMSAYRMSPSDLLGVDCILTENPYYRSAEPMHLYNLDQVILAARRAHGGQIGVDAAVNATKLRSAKMSEAKEQKKKDRRQQVNDAFSAAGLDQSLVYSEIERFVLRNRNRTTAGNLVALAQDIIEKERHREAREQELKTALAAEGLDRKLAGYKAIQYVEYNCGSPASVMEAIREAMAERARREARQSEVEEKLAEIGLTLKQELVHAWSYINHHSTTIELVLEDAKQEDWLTRCTNYANLRYSHIHYVDYLSEPRYHIQGDRAETKVLLDWVRKRFHQNNFRACSEDPDNDERPPQTLWTKISQIMVNAVVSTCKEKFLLAVNRELGLSVLAAPANEVAIPTETVTRIINSIGDSCVWDRTYEYTMNGYAIRHKAESSKAESSKDENSKAESDETKSGEEGNDTEEMDTENNNPGNNTESSDGDREASSLALSDHKVLLSDLLLREDGEQWALNLVQSTRERIFQNAKDRLAAELKENEPTELTEFINRHMQDSMSMSRSDWMRIVQEFKEQQAPSIAAALEIHEDHIKHFMSRFNDRHNLARFRRR